MLLALLAVRRVRWITARFPHLHTPQAALILLSLAAFCLGAARYQATRPVFTDQQLAWYNDSSEPVEVFGVLVQPPDVRDTHVQVTFQVEEIRPEDGPAIPVEGRLLAWLPTGVAWQYGDRVRLWGQLQTPPVNEDFSYKDYLARQGVYSYMPYAAAELVAHDQGSDFLSRVYAFKSRGVDLIYSYLPDPEASLLAGIVLGVESGIPEHVDEDFTRTGTTHIIAISGFNITIVAGLFAMLFGRIFGPRRGAVVALVAITVYTVMVGADAPVVRAAIMGGLSLFGGQIGRRQHGLNSLAFTAGLMAAFNPNLLWDVGFQLSFTATLGLVLYAEPWTQAFEGWLGRWLTAEKAQKVAAPVSEYFLLTLAAQLTTLPILAYHFQRLSLVSLPANLVILPAQPPVMILGGAAVLLGAVFAPLGQLVAYLVWPFLAYTIRVVAWFARWQQGTFVVDQFHPLWVAVFFIGLLSVTFFWEPVKAAVRSNLKPASLLIGLSIPTILVWQVVLSAPDGRLHVTFLDVGRGEAILIQTPEGRRVLIGGGESVSRLSEGLGRELPLFQRKLDLLVVADVENEHLAALPGVLERHPPAQVWWAGDAQDTRSARELSAALAEKHITVEEMYAGQVLALGQGAALEVLAVGEQGAALLLRWEGFWVLLPLGIAPDQLTADPVRTAAQGSTAVLLPAGGAVEANPAAWLAGLHPNMVVLSVEAGGGLPDQETLEALEGAFILRTDHQGWIELVTDGGQVWLYVEKE